MPGQHRSSCPIDYVPADGLVRKDLTHHELDGSLGAPPAWREACSTVSREYSYATSLPLLFSTCSLGAPLVAAGGIMADGDSYNRHAAQDCERTERERTSAGQLQQAGQSGPGPGGTVEGRRGQTQSHHHGEGRLSRVGAEGAGTAGQQDQARARLAQRVRRGAVKRDDPRTGEEPVGHGAVPPMAR